MSTTDLNMSSHTPSPAVPHEDDVEYDITSPAAQTLNECTNKSTSVVDEENIKEKVAATEAFALQLVQLAKVST